MAAVRSECIEEVYDNEAEVEKEDEENSSPADSSSESFGVKDEDEPSLEHGQVASDYESLGGKLTRIMMATTTTALVTSRSCGFIVL
jgi:hypothetical protein